LLDHQVILIDDLGSERGTEAARAAMFYLIDQLYGARKRLIVTSNQLPKDIHAFESRIMSRLTEVCTLVEVAADDYRIRSATQRLKAGQSAPRASGIVN
jgi:DNA replication protein DnaC